jgi:hypothetical protein
MYRAVMTLYSKIATALRSREISQINDYDGLTPPAAEKKDLRVEI